MVESQIRTNAVTNTRLLKALREVPREVFVPPSMRSLAYMDAPLQVEAARDGYSARYLLPPMVLAKLAQLARIEPTAKVLDIGPGTGYSTMVLAQLAGRVVAVESDPGLVALAKDALTAQGVKNVEFREGALNEGAADAGPYQAIFVNGRVAVKPEKLLAQLSQGGRLVAVVGGDVGAKACLFQKIDGAVRETVEFDAAAPMLPGFEARPAFVF